MPARKLLGTIIAAALFLPDTGYALGLGEIEVNSALNQKLNADIELLSAVPEDTETIIVKLASRKEFLRAGLDRPYLLNDLRFKSVLINGMPYIKVSSSGPIREPFLNFLVEIDWPNGHLLREYTVLLDPPVFMTEHTSAAANVAPATLNNNGFRPGSSASNAALPVVTPGVSVSSRPSSTTQAPVAQVQPGTVSQAPFTSQTNWIPAPVIQQSSSSQPAGSYRIKTGDTAWSLADAMRPDQSITVPQMMVAMLRANPESFINENINGLKRGYILRVPDYDQVASISQADAWVLVREQAALWRQYQQSQAGGQPVSAMEADDTATSTGVNAGSAAGSENDAYLEIVSAGSGSSARSGKDPTQMSEQELRAELALARERVETELVEKEALQQRIDSLQKDVEQMKGILSIEDAELAEAQSLNLAVEGEQAEQAMIDESATEDSDVNAVDEDLADMSAEAVLDEMDVAAAVDEVAELAEEELAEEAADEIDLFVDEPLTEDGTTAEMPEQVAPATDDFVAAQAPVVDRKPADLLTQLLNDPMMLAAAGGGLLLFVALIGLIIKRRKAATETAAPVTTSGFNDLESLADDIASEEADTGEAGQALPANDEESVADSASASATTKGSAEDTSIAQSDDSADLDEDKPRDDVIAEADVYLAYGIYQQAEELLKQAIADNPERDDYRLKLAETHYAGKNADAFVEVASDIKQRVDEDTSPLWKKVLGMGQDLCADNPMFQGTIVDAPDVDSLSPDSPEMDFDLGTGDVKNETSDADSSLDEQSLELSELEAEAGAVKSVDELEFDLSDTGAVEESTDEEDGFSLDIDASELGIEINNQDEGIDLTDDDEVSLDLTEIDIGLEEVTDNSLLDVDKTAVAGDAADVDIDFGIDNADTGSQVAVADEAIAIDLTEEAELMDIDLSEGANDEIKVDDDAIEIAAAASDDFIDDEEDFDLSSLDDVDEISTKLDLARAYLDMGDHEGTKGILEEVLADGDDEQKTEASELMARLG
jgi:pilus assembly protein FimV